MTAGPTPMAYPHGGDDRPAGTGRVLVVDDDPVLARTLAGILAGEGLQCETAFSAGEALTLLSPAIDLVLCDVYMPDGSGLDLTRQVKERDNLTQVVVMTGYAEIDTVVRALRTDADDFLAKPVEPAHLVHAVRRALEHRRLLLEERDYQLRLEARLREQSDHLTRFYVSSIHSLVTALDSLPDHLARQRNPGEGEPDSLADVERRHIVRVLEHTDGNRAEAARILGIGRTTLYDKIARYGLRDIGRGSYTGPAAAAPPPDAEVHAQRTD